MLVFIYSNEEKQSWGFYEEIANELVWKKAEEYKSQFKNKDNIVKCEVEIKQYLEKTVGTDDEDFGEEEMNQKIILDF